MELGNMVKKINFPDYGFGKIINIKNIFGKQYFSVYFESIGKIIEAKQEELENNINIKDMFFRGIFSSPEEFQFSIQGQKLNSLYYADLGVAVGNFKIKPLPHQILTLNFVLNKFRPRCILADEVGLGKTIEAALVYEELKLRGMVKRILIICPASLGKQWQEEFEMKFGENFFLMDKEAAASLKNLYGEKVNIWNEYDRIICSMDFLKPRKVGENLSEKELQRRESHNKRIFQDCVDSGWDIVIIDEAHKLTKDDEATARYRMGKEFSNTVPIFLLLSATPHRGKPEIFKSLLQLIDEEMFQTQKDVNPENVKKVCIRNNKRATVDMDGKRLFKDRITDICKIDRSSEEDAIEVELYDQITNYISEYYNYAVQEKNQVMMFLLLMYQRIVSSSSHAILRALSNRLEKLSNKIITIDEVSFLEMDELFEATSEDQIEILENSIISLNSNKFIKKEKEIVERCIELAKRATVGRNDSKFKMLLRIIDKIKIRENRETVKIIVFTEFKETQKYLKNSLETLGYEIAIINGSLSLDEKMQQKDFFKEKADFLISTDAGGEGLNLQFSAYMINYDIPWNPMMLEQRIGRIDRIGQNETVKIFNFVIKDSVEERVRETLEKKLEIIKEQFGTDQIKDILSTLQEEFSFDKIYIDAVRFRKQQSDDLEKIAESIYNEANEILKNNQFLLPFTEEKELDEIQKNIYETLPEKIKNLVISYLKLNNSKLEEYRDKKEVYFFNVASGNISYKNIIFDAQMGLLYENTEVLGLQSEFIKKIIKESGKQGQISKFSLNNKNFNNIKGILSYYKLIIKNNLKYKKEIYFPIFVDSENKFNARITNFLDNLQIFSFSNYQEKDYDFEKKLEKIEEIANQVGEEKFLSLKIEWNKKVDEKINQLEKYYMQKENAISKISIENIRESKLKKMKNEYLNQKKNFEIERELFPELECSQIALISFGNIL